MEYVEGGDCATLLKVRPAIILCFFFSVETFPAKTDPIQSNLVKPSNTRQNQVTLAKTQQKPERKQSKSSKIQENPANLAKNYVKNSKT